MENNFIESTKKNVNYWWVSLLVGILAVIVGIMSTAQPLVTIGILTAFFIASFFVSGIFETIFAITHRSSLNKWGWMLAEGIVNLVFACILMALPIGNMLIFIYYVSFYVLLQSLMGIWGSFTLKTFNIKEWWVFLLVALLGFILSLILIFSPVFAANFITIIFAATLICYGLFRIFYSFRLKKLKEMFD